MRKRVSSFEKQKAFEKFNNAGLTVRQKNIIRDELVRALIEEKETQLGVQYSYRSLVGTYDSPVAALQTAVYWFHEKFSNKV